MIYYYTHEKPKLLLPVDLFFPGAFLIPYFGTLALVGLPLFFLELSYGQFASLGPIAAWSLNPLFKGMSELICIVGLLMFAHTHTHAHAHMQMSTHIILLHLHTCVHTFIHKYINTYIHTRIHA